MAKSKESEVIDVPSTAVAQHQETKSPKQSMAVVNPFDMPVALFQESIDRRRDNRTALMRTIKQMLVEDIDYGRIHTKSRKDCRYGGPPKCTFEAEPCHWSKHSLFKPGAEKICGFLGVTVIYPNYPEYENAALSGTEIKQIILRCHILTASGQVVADGIGARAVEKDYGDLNKALKMASKSALIAATLNMAGLSEVFSQDFEDMYPEGKPAAAEQATLSVEQIAVIEKAISTTFNDQGTEKLIQKICQAYSVKALSEIPAKSLPEILERIEAAKKAAAKKPAK